MMPIKIKSTLIILLLGLFACTSLQSDYSSEYSRSRIETGLMWPLKGKVTSHYGPRSGSFHHGVDIKGKKNTNIYSVAPGIVEFSGSMRGYGNTIIVRHEGFKTLYAHCFRLKVKKGQSVREGQSVGTVGTSGKSSGYHLHFEYRTLADNKKNPLHYLRKAGS